MSNNRQYVFIENLNVVSWLTNVFPYLRKEGRQFSQGEVILSYVYCSQAGLWLSSLMGRLINTRVEMFNFSPGDMRDKEGCSLHLQVGANDMVNMHAAIVNNPVFTDLIGHDAFKDSNLRYYLEKLLMDYGYSNNIFTTLLTIRFARWTVDRLTGEENRDITLFLNNRIWWEEINDYAQKHNVSIRPAAFLRCSLKEKIVRLIGKNRIKSCCFKLTELKYIFFKDGFEKNSCKNSTAIIGEGPPKLSVNHYGHFNVDHPELHSDVFFLNRSSFDAKDLLMIYTIKKDPFDKEKEEINRRYGITALSTNPSSKIINRIPTFYFWPKAGQKQSTLWRELDRLTDQNPNKEFKQPLYTYSQDLEYWSDLFQRTRTKVYLTWYKYCPMHIMWADAVKSAGGILAMYQRAFEACGAPSTMTVADVYFGFSTLSAHSEKLSRSRIKYHVITGYNGDYRFAASRQTAGVIRDQLKSKGAEKIIAYFDESSNDTRWHTGNKYMAYNYQFLLEKLLNDPHIGIVLKPKSPHKLRARLGKVAKLLKKAEETGRCFVMEKGQVQNKYPPAIAALASDVAIHGHLAAGTAGMEAALTGVPTLLLDREGWPISKLYDLEKNRVAFTNWEDLWRTCIDHWNSREGVPGFGDWSPIINEIDPFRDGRGAERVGNYLKWLIDGFKAGLSRETVMADAAQRYAELWGKDKITSINVSNPLRKETQNETMLSTIGEI